MTRRSAAAAAMVLATLAPAIPAGAYPPAGIDVFASTALVFVTAVPGCVVDQFTQAVTLEGDTKIHRSDSVVLDTGQRSFDTEILSMELSGTGPAGPVTVTEHPDVATTGRVTSVAPDTDFPALSYFDVSVLVTIAGIVFETLSPVHMESLIYSLPPHVFPYLPPPGTCIPLALRGTLAPVLWLIHAEHVPLTLRICYPILFKMILADAGGQLLLGGGQGELQFVTGEAQDESTPVDADMVELKGQGQLFDQRGEIHDVSVAEDPAQGSFGVLPQPAAGTFSSFFDVFADVTVDGRASQVKMPMAGDPRPPEGNLVHTGHEQVGGYTLQFFEVDLVQAAAGCVEPYPPA